MKFKNPKEQIEYLKGRVNGLEEALESILELIASGDVSELPSKIEKLEKVSQSSNKFKTTSLIDSILQMR